MTPAQRVELLRQLLAEIQAATTPHIHRRAQVEERWEAVQQELDELAAELADAD